MEPVKIITKGNVNEIFQNNQLFSWPVSFMMKLQCAMALSLYKI